MRVVRGYDSLQRCLALDFGWGWSVDYQSTSIRKNKVLGLGWEVASSGFFGLCLRPVGTRKVAVTLPDGKLERFTAANAQKCASFQVPPVDIRFTPQAGTTSRLEVIRDGTLVQAQGGQLINADTGGAWNPSRFKLTTDDGYSYFLKEGLGIKQIRDPFGNTLTYGRDGIVHSTGLSVAFERDAAGRIVKITDPGGQSLRYDYNRRGELVAMTDRAGLTSRFTYAREHLPADYTDPRGVKVG